MPAHSTLQSIAYAFPRLVAVRTMTPEQFERTFERFVREFASEAVVSAANVQEHILVSVISAPLAAPASGSAHTVAELADSLARSGTASSLLLQLEAIRDGATVINNRRLSDFVERFSAIRHFVQLDDDGFEYMIIG